MEQRPRPEWTKERVLQLIELWQPHECLYNAQHKFYANKAARRKALAQITEQLQDAMPQLCETDVRTKINYLRSQYCREMHKYKNSMQTDDLAYWFESLSFIKKFVRIRSSSMEEDNTPAMSHVITTKNEETSSDEVLISNKRLKIGNTTNSTARPADDPFYFYKPDPDILDLLQEEISKNHSIESAESNASNPNTASSSKSNEVAFAMEIGSRKSISADAANNNKPSISFSKKSSNNRSIAPSITNSNNHSIKSSLEITSSMESSSKRSITSGMESSSKDSITSSTMNDISKNSNSCSMMKSKAQCSKPGISDITPAGSSAGDPNNYEETFMNFIKINLSMIHDATLKDELRDKITLLLLEYKRKERELRRVRGED